MTSSTHGPDEVEVGAVDVGKFSADKDDVVLVGADVILGSCQLRRVQRAVSRLQAVWGRGRANRWLKIKTTSDNAIKNIHFICYTFL